MPTQRNPHNPLVASTSGITRVLRLVNPTRCLHLADSPVKTAPPAANLVPIITLGLRMLLTGVVARKAKSLTTIPVNAQSSWILFRVADRALV